MVESGAHDPGEINMLIYPGIFLYRPPSKTH